MIKSLDLTKNANNLYISVKQRSKDKTTSFTNIGQAILFKDWKFFEKNSFFKASGTYGVEQNDDISHKIEDSLKNLKAKQDIHYKKPHIFEKSAEIEDIPQYYDIYDKPNVHYRHLFKPNMNENEENSEISKIYYSTPQEARQKNKHKLLTNLNSVLSKLKNSELPAFDNSLKKVRFTDSHISNSTTNLLENAKSLKNNDTQKKIKIDELNPEDDGFYTCTEGCGRKFTRSALFKHTKICKNVFLSKKDPFDITKHRKLKESQDIDNRMRIEQHEINLMKERMELLKQEKEKIEAFKNRPENFPKWKKESEALRSVMRDNNSKRRYLDPEFIKEGLSKGKYVKCEGCGRQFNEKAAEIHIENCIDRVKVLKLHKKKMII